MSWECVDALSLIQDLQTSCDTKLAEQNLENAKTLWRQNSKAEAFNLILSTLETTTNQLTFQLPILEQLKEKVKAASFHIDEIENRLTAVENRDRAKDKTIKQLQQEQEQALVCKAKLQQKISLGQIAYTLSDVLEDFVFGEAGSGSFLPLSVSDYANNTMELSEEKQVRWTAARKFLTSTMPLKEIIEADQYLRWLGNVLVEKEPAHGNSPNMETSVSNLHMWAGVYCKAEAVAPVQRYLLVLNKLSTSGRPLAPDKSLAMIAQHQ
ncbi:hypothetical protein ABBQ38_010298 [Trebouxia sp. C0009 RCD-2024]